MLAGINPQLWPMRSSVLLSCRMLSTKDKKPSSQTQKPPKSETRELGPTRAQTHGAPPTNELLKDFLKKTPRDMKRYPKTKTDRPIRNLLECESGEESIKVPESRRMVALDVIKSKDLLRDFLDIEGQPGKRMTRQIAQDERRLARVHHTEPLPQPSALKLFTKDMMQQVTKSSVSDQYQNDVFDYVESLETSMYRARSTYNKFDELIQWTLDGKLWQYPIDNEQDWHKELETTFSEHIFLNRGRSKWRPAPLNHFMQLVCAGLAQNPYISAQEKREHVDWFEGYFASKVGSIEAAVEEEERLASAESGARGDRVNPYSDTVN